MRRIDSMRGFGMMEFLLTILILSVFSGALFTFYRGQVYAFRSFETGLEVKEKAEMGIDFMVREIRMAGARPTGVMAAGCGLPVPALAIVPACDGFEGITSASGASITFRYDYRGNNPGTAPDGCPNDDNELITYTYDPAAGELSRTAQGGGTAMVLDDIAPNGVSFRYFTRSGTEIAPGGGPLTQLERANVSAIVVDIETAAPHPDPRVNETIDTRHNSTVFRRNPPC